MGFIKWLFNRLFKKSSFEAPQDGMLPEWDLRSKLDFIKSYGDAIGRLLSEIDQGKYDAEIVSDLLELFQRQITDLEQILEIILSTWSQSDRVFVDTINFQKQSKEFKALIEDISRYGSPDLFKKNLVRLKEYQNLVKEDIDIIRQKINARLMILKKLEGVSDRYLNDKKLLDRLNFDYLLAIRSSDHQRHSAIRRLSSDSYKYLEVIERVNQIINQRSDEAKQDMSVKLGYHSKDEVLALYAGYQPYWKTWHDYLIQIAKKKNQIDSRIWFVKQIPSNLLHNSPFVAIRHLIAHSHYLITDLICHLPVF